MRAAAAPLVRPLRHRAFVQLWAGQAISRLGGAANTVVLSWSVVVATGSPAALGVVLAAFSAAQLLALAGAGVLGDRLSRRGLLVGGQAAYALAALGLAVASGSSRFGLLAFVAASLGQGAAAGVTGPVSAPLLKAAVGDDEEIQAATSLDAIAQGIAGVAGAALGGLLYAAGHAGGAFGLIAAGFAACALLAGTAPLPRQAPAEAGPAPLAEALAGLRYVAGRAWLTTIILLSAAANLLAVAPFAVLLPLVLRREGYGAGVAGAVFAVQAGGELAATAVLGQLVARRRGLVFVALAAMVGAAGLVLGSHGGLLVAFSASLAMGAGMSAGMVEHTLLLRNVRERYLSRVYSVDMIGSFLVAPASSALAGGLAARLGPAPVLLAGGALQIALCGAALARGPLRSFD